MFKSDYTDLTLWHINPHIHSSTLSDLKIWGPMRWHQWCSTWVWRSSARTRRTQRMGGGSSGGVWGMWLSSAERCLQVPFLMTETFAWQGLFLVYMMVHDMARHGMNFTCDHRGLSPWYHHHITGKEAMHTSFTGDRCQANVLENMWCITGPPVPNCQNVGTQLSIFWISAIASLAPALGQKCGHVWDEGCWWMSALVSLGRSVEQLAFVSISLMICNPRKVSQALMAIALNGEKERISVHEEHVWKPNSPNWFCFDLCFCSDFHDFFTVVFLNDFVLGFTLHWP